MGRKKSRRSKNPRKSGRKDEKNNNNSPPNDSCKSDEEEEKNNDNNNSPPNDSHKSDEEDENINDFPPHVYSTTAKCVICLEIATNITFTDNCFHVFCLNCILRWCQVKPECPLCKQNIESVIYNVRSFKQFNRCIIPRFTRVEPEPSPFILPNISLQQLEDYISHRMRFAPHSINGHRIALFNPANFVQPRRTINSFRQRVYNENLWVIPPNPNRVRKISPYLYRSNIESTDRLVNFLNREFLVLLPHHDGSITFVIELILALLPKYDIRSSELRSIVEGYTGIHTSHFIHEFYNFAISIYESLDIYDSHAQFTVGPRQASETVSSPNNETIPIDTTSSVVSTENRKCDVPVPMDNTTSNGALREKKQSPLSEKHSKEPMSPNKLILKKNEKNVWESFPNSIPPEFCGPSTSRGNPFFKNLPEKSETDDDEIQIIKIIKPKSKRTHAAVNISSGNKPSKAKRTKTTKVKDNDLASMNVSDDADDEESETTKDSRTVSKKRRNR